MNKIVNYGFKALFLAGIVVSVSQAWNGRALPVAYDQQTGKWFVLLGLNRGPSGFWNDFGAQGSRGGPKANVVAQEALKTQTNGRYDVQIDNKMPWYRFNDDFVHFVPVPYIADLSGAIGSKEDLFWVSEDILLGQGDVYLRAKTRGGVNVNISRGLLAYFRQYWPHARGQLSTTASAQTSATTSTQTSAQAGTWSPARN